MHAQDTYVSLLSSRISEEFQRGRIFFSEDLEHVISDRMTLRATLSVMVKEGSLITRLGHGIYCYPRVDSRFRMVLPGEDLIANALARRYGVRILPGGARAARAAGLSVPEVFSHEYITDGNSQYFHLYSGKTVRFVRRTSVKVFCFENEDMRNLCEGFRYLGEGRVEEKDRKAAAKLLAKIPPEVFEKDLKLCPGWIREEFRSIRGFL